MDASEKETHSLGSCVRANRWLEQSRGERCMVSCGCSGFSISIIKQTEREMQSNRVIFLVFSSMSRVDNVLVFWLFSFGGVVVLNLKSPSMILVQDDETENTDSKFFLLLVSSGLVFS